MYAGRNEPGKNILYLTGSKIVGEWWNRGANLRRLSIHAKSAKIKTRRSQSLLSKIF